MSFQLAQVQVGAMRTRMIVKYVIPLLLAAAACMANLRAELPSLEKAIWRGYFAGYEGRICLFGVTAKGELNLQLQADTKKGNNGEGIGASPMNILIRIEELLPNAKPTTRTIQPDSLKTTDEPTDKLEKTVICGKVTGDASFELTIERERDTFTISNRLVDAGELTKNEIRPVVLLQMRQLYPYDGSPKLTKPEIRERTKDTLELKWTDGTQKKFSLIEEMDANSADVNGPGIAIAQIEAGGLIRDRKLTLEAPEGHSIIQISNSTPQMLSRGLRFSAMPAPAKPGGKPNDTARLIIRVR